MPELRDDTDSSNKKIEWAVSLVLTFFFMLIFVMIIMALSIGV